MCERCGRASHGSWVPIAPTRPRSSTPWPSGGPGHDPGDSALEARALLAIARAGLPIPVQQHAVRRPDGRAAYVDLAYPDQMVAIELDGYEHHRTRTVFDHDRAVRTTSPCSAGASTGSPGPCPNEDIVATVARAIGWPEPPKPPEPPAPR